MNSPLEDALAGVTESVIAYMPNLLAGAVLLLIGGLLAWLAKRVMVQIFLVLRLDRVVRRFRWGTGLEKADVRFALAEAAGNGVSVIVFLILLDAALNALQLSVISEVITEGVMFIPKFLIASLILGLGYLLAGAVAAAVQRALTKEDVPRATLIGRFTKTVIILFVAAMALTELNLAREIVLIGFSVTITTLGVLVIVMTIIGGKKFVTKVLESFEE